MKYLYLILLLLTSPSWATSYTAVSGGGNWSNNATWGGSGHPIAGDTAILASTSGSVTVDTASACLAVTCGGYTNATGLVVSNNLTTTGGVTLASGAGYSQAAGATWIASASTYNFASKTLTNLQMNSTGNFTFTAATTPTVTNLSIANGFTATLVTNAPALGTGGSVSLGTGILAGLTLTVGGAVNQTIQTSSTGYISSNLTFNTSGSVTILNTFNYRTGTLTYAAGTIVVTGSTLNIGASATLATSGMTWNDVTVSATSTLTNTSAINTSGGGFQVTGGTCTLATNGVNATGNGAVSVVTGGTLTGSAVTMTGNSSIQTTGTGVITSGLCFNASSATVTLNGVVNYNTGIMTYMAGGVNSAAATLNISGTSTINMGSGVTIANVQFSGANVVQTLASGNFYMTNCIVANTGSMSTVTNGLMITGNLTFTNAGSIYGTQDTLIGSGAVTCQSTGGIGTSNLNINTSGSITFSGSLNFSSNGTLSYTAGTVVNNGAVPCTLVISANATVLTDATNTWPYLISATSGNYRTLTLTNPNHFTYVANTGTSGLVFATSGCSINSINEGQGNVYDSSAGGMTLLSGRITGSGGVITGLVYEAGAITLSGAVGFGSQGGASQGVTVNYQSGSIVGDGTETLSLNVPSGLGSSVPSGVFDFPYSFSIVNFSISGSASAPIKLTAGKTIMVTKNFIANGNPGGITIQSATGSSPTYISVAGTASLPPVCSIVTFTDIDFSGGRMVLDTGGTVSGVSKNVTTNSSLFYQNPGWRHNW